MSTRNLGWFREVARYARSAASMGLVFLSVRFAWLSSAEAMAEVRQEAVQQKDEASSPRTEQTRADPKRVADQFRDLPKATEPSAEPEADQPRLRRLLVDLGPERSEVFVQGKVVGRVPFAGQISCVEGHAVVIDVLPPHGAPLQRTLTCRSAHLSVTR